MSIKSCAITGHRPARFKWKYKENNTGCKRLKKRLRDQIVALYEQGVRRFYVGGALGVDMWAGEILLQLKEQPEYNDIELFIALPFEGQRRCLPPPGFSCIRAPLLPRRRPTAFAVGCACPACARAFGLWKAGAGFPKAKSCRRRGPGPLPAERAASPARTGAGLGRLLCCGAGQNFAAFRIIPIHEA